MSYPLRFILLPLLLVISPVLMADDRQAAMDAVESVIFELDEIGVEYINYRVDASGNVSMTVDDTVPDALYVKLLDRIRGSRAVNSVLASQGPVCPIPYKSNSGQ